MDFRNLGNTSVRVSELCLGTMTFGDTADEATSHAIVDRYLDCGGNFIDTADSYGRGASEEIVGRALGDRRGGVVLATKGGMAMSDDPNDRGANRLHLIAAVDASLRRLRTDWIDLYQIHWPDVVVSPEETLSTLDSLVRDGKLRYIGVSNYLASHLATMVALQDHYRWAPVVSNQPQYSLVSREIELEILPFCDREGIAVLPWSPLGGGVLSGKYHAGQQPPRQTRIGDSERQTEWRLNERNLAIAEEVARVAQAIGRTSAQVALNWVLHRPGITAPIVGARTVAQLEENLGASGWQLDEEHQAALSQVSRSPLPYPHDMYRMLGVIDYSRWA